MARRAAIYLRVSTQEQTTQNQAMELTAAAERMGLQVVETYEDHGISGAKGRDKRPQFDKLLKDSARRKFDIVLVWSIDRIGRSMKDLVLFVEDLKASKIELYSHRQGIDTTTPSGKSFYYQCGIFAEYEREMIIERTKAGIARARIHGTKSGKPIGKKPLSQKLQQDIKDSLAKGISYRKTAQRLDVALSTVVKFSGKQDTA